MITKAIYNLLFLPGVDFFFEASQIPEDICKRLLEGEEILFLMQKEDKEYTHLQMEDFFDLGIVGRYKNKNSEGNICVHMERRVRISDIRITDGNIEVTYAETEIIEDLEEEQKNAIFKQVQDAFIMFMRNFQWDIRTAAYLIHISNFPQFTCSVMPFMNTDPQTKYKILAAESQSDLYLMMKDAVMEFIEIYRISEEAEKSQKEHQEGVYREIAIKKQLEFLQKQLDNMHPENITDVRMFEKKIEESGMNPEARREADKVLNRMKREGENSHEYGIMYDYLDFMTSLHWTAPEQEPADIKRAEQILDEDHYGLRKVKRRVIEQLAVMSLKKEPSGSILLFTGPPGTGKTSIGQSIARALGRKYVRISLGGVRDEADIRGHRRTYIGAMPGRIMEGIRRSDASNPVMVLDEVDKIGKDYNGDPASALLEALDPEQNSNFTDHYMNVSYDLSRVLFICTANRVDTIPEPLLNRMEVISFSGYTPEEKFQIAKKHLLPKALKENGLTAAKCKVMDDTIRKLIFGYTSEAGVRGLKRQLNALCRHTAVNIASGKQKSFQIGPGKLREYLDEKEILHDALTRKTRPGIVTGLAWTQAGGEILFVEAALTKGSGKLIITGQLGDVMKESVQIAESLVKVIVPGKAAMFTKSDLHIHVPEGAVPKDGPSAGITITTAILSLIFNKEVLPEIAMTGEVSLRGYVLPIGGLPEKLMAAERAGVKKVLIPKDNVRDLEDVPEEIKKKLEIIPVDTVEEAEKEVFGEIL